MNPRARIILWAIATLGLIIGQVGPAGAETPVKFTVTVESAYVRDAPSAAAPVTYSVFQGQTFTVTGRNGTASWVSLDLAGASKGTWIPVSYGSVAGDLSGVTVMAATTAPAVPVVVTTATPRPTNAAPPPPPPTAPIATTIAPLPPWIPVITTHMRQIYQRSSRYGRSLRMFTVAGDCNSEGSLHLEWVPKGLIDPQAHGYLQPTVKQFRSAFFRESLAVDGGFNTASMFVPLWADSKQCLTNEGPFACELRASRASIVFIMLGTGDQHLWRDFEANYRPIVEYALKKRVLPVLVTKVDALEAQEGGAEEEYINNVVRRLAREYEVPLLDFWLATRALPNQGLREEPGNDFHLSLEAHRALAVAMVQALHVIWRP